MKKSLLPRAAKKSFCDNIFYSLINFQCNFSPVSGCLPALFLIPLHTFKMQLLSAPVAAMAYMDVEKVLSSSTQ
jgi:hypothetical protein